MRILVATDGSEQSDAAVAEMARRPFPPNTEIHVVSAFQRFAPPAGVSMGAMGEFYAEVDQAARNLSQGAVERAARVCRVVHLDLWRWFAGYPSFGSGFVKRNVAP